MADTQTIRVIHELDKATISQFAKAAEKISKAVGVEKQTDMKKVTSELKKQVVAQDKIIKKEQESLGIVGKLLNTRKELEKARKDAKTKKELEKVNSELRKVNTQLKKAKETTTGWSKAVGSFAFKFNFLANIISNVVSAAFRKLGQIVKEGVTTIMDFEYAMAAVKAISGATGREFQKLRQDAIRLGGSTIYTAVQVSALQLAFAKLGFSTQEILNATEATLTLAAATGEDLAQSALVAGSTLRAFQLDATEMQRVVDIMAKSFTSSALNLDHWRESMKFVAPIAQKAGISIEGTAAILGVLADTGLRGSLAGTAMKNVFLRIADSSSLLSKRIGFTVRNMEDFVRALYKLNAEGITLNEILKITDKRAAPAMSSLISLADVVEELYEAEKKAGAEGKAAFEMAEIRMDTLKGSLIIMKSAWEGFIIAAESGTSVLTVKLRVLLDTLTGILNVAKQLVTDPIILIQTEAYEEAKEVFDKYKDELEKREKESGMFFIKVEEEITAKIIELENEKYKKTQELLAKNLKLRKTGRAKDKKDAIEHLELEGARLDEFYTAQTEALEGYLKRRIKENKILNAILGIEEDRFAAFRIDAMEEGDAKEIALIELKYQKKRDALGDVLIDEEKHVGQLDELYRQYEQNEIDEIAAYWKKKENAELKARQKAIDRANRNAEKMKKYREKQTKEELDSLRQAAKDEIEIQRQTYIQMQEEDKAHFDLTEEELEQYAKDREIFELELQIRILEIQAYYGDKSVEVVRATIGAIRAEIAKLKGTIEESGNWWDEWITKITESLGISESELKEAVREVEKALKSIAGFWKDLADEQIFQINRTISRQDRAIEEAQRRMQTEINKGREGNVIIIRDEENKISRLKSAREKALKEQEELLKKQRAIEAVNQAISLTTASARLFNALSVFGIKGMVIAGALIVAMLASFAATRSRIAKLTEEGLEEGDYGTIEGRRHKQGGEKFLDHIKVEKGEMWSVYNRRGSQKYGKEIETFTDAINKDKFNNVWSALNIGLNREQLFEDKPIIIVEQENKKTNELLGVISDKLDRPIDLGHYIEFKKDGIIYRYLK